MTRSLVSWKLWYLRRLKILHSLQHLWVIHYLSSPCKSLTLCCYLQVLVVQIDFFVCYLCVWVFFVYRNLYVDTVNLTTPMDLSGIPWIFIYLLFLRGTLPCYITRPHFLWLRLSHVKAHVQLVYYIYNFKQKNIVLNLYNVLAIFLYFDCVFVFCLIIKINVLTKCILQHSWTSLEYREYLYTCYSWEVHWYIVQRFLLYWM